MPAIIGGPSFEESPLTRNLFFARRPEPDLEFTEVWLDDAATIGAPSSAKPLEQSPGRPLLWILVFVLIGGGVYVATGPELVTESVGPLLGTPPTPQPSVARHPGPPSPAPSKQPEQDWSFLATDHPLPSTTEPIQTASAPATAPATAEQPEQDWSFLAPTQPIIPSPPAPEPPAAPPAPLFREGQRVRIRPDPAAPDLTVRLRHDVQGTQPGPAVPPGTLLTVLDGALQENGWVYFVRSDVGSEGWLTEGQLRSTR
jgi:hypothetical protein